MLFTSEVLKGIAKGKVTLAFRRWRKPRVKPLCVTNSEVGLVAITSIEPVLPSALNDRDAKRAGYPDVKALRRDLDAWPGTIYRMAVKWWGPDPRRDLSVNLKIERAELKTLTKDLEPLLLIAKRPGTRAAELAARLGRDKEKLKRDVRKLKNLGLTLSLKTGYRISPRGLILLTLLGVNIRTWTSSPTR